MNWPKAERITSQQGNYVHTRSWMHPWPGQRFALRVPFSFNLEFECQMTSSLRWRNVFEWFWHGLWGNKIKININIRLISDFHRKNIEVISSFQLARNDFLHCFKCYITQLFWKSEMCEFSEAEVYFITQHLCWKLKISWRCIQINILNRHFYTDVEDYY